MLHRSLVDVSRRCDIGIKRHPLGLGFGELLASDSERAKNKARIVRAMQAATTRIAAQTRRLINRNADSNAGAAEADAFLSSLCAQHADEKGRF
jgi:hypothetical protein